jgi:hypothetical protein
MKTAIETPKRFTTYRKLVVLIQKARASKSLNEIQEASEKAFEIYEAHAAKVAALITDQNFEPVEGVDFNHWAHDQLDTLIKGLDKIKDLWYDLHYDLKGFNVY